MSLVKPVTVTPAELPANRANARRSTGPLLARVIGVREARYADGVALAIYAVSAGDATNPQCPLESTDRNSEASLFPFRASPLSRPTATLSPGRGAGGEGERPERRLARKAFADQLLHRALYQRTHNVA